MCDTSQNIEEGVSRLISPADTISIPGFIKPSAQKNKRIGGNKVTSLFSVLMIVLSDISDAALTDQTRQTLKSSFNIKDRFHEAFDLILKKHNCFVQIFTVQPPNKDDEVRCRYTGQLKHESLNLCYCIKRTFATDFSVIPSDCVKVISLLLVKNQLSKINNYDEFLNNKWLTVPKMMDSPTLMNYLQSVECIATSYKTTTEFNTKDATQLTPGAKLHFFSSKHPPTKILENENGECIFQNTTLGYMRTGCISNLAQINYIIFRKPEW